MQSSPVSESLTREEHLIQLFNLHWHTIITQNLESKTGVPCILHSGAFAKGTMKCNHYKFIQKNYTVLKFLSSNSSSLTLPKHWQLWLFSSVQWGWNHMLGRFSRLAYFNSSYMCDVHLNFLLVFRWQEAWICFVIVELFFFVVFGVKQRAWNILSKQVSHTTSSDSLLLELWSILYCFCILLFRVL